MAGFGSLTYDRLYREIVASRLIYTTKKLYTGNQTVVISRAGRPTANIQGRIHRRLLALFQALDKQSPLATPTKRHKSLE